MIHIKRFLWTFFLLIAIFLIRALFFITNEESSKIKHQQSSTISSSFISNSIPEMKQGIYEGEQSGKSVKVEIAARGKIYILSDYVLCEGLNKTSAN